jgi:hypothetical protein
VHASARPQAPGSVVATVERQEAHSRKRESISTQEACTGGRPRTQHTLPQPRAPGSGARGPAHRTGPAARILWASSALRWPPPSCTRQCMHCKEPSGLQPAAKGSWQCGPAGRCALRVHLSPQARDGQANMDRAAGQLSRIHPMAAQYKQLYTQQYAQQYMQY